MSLPWFQNKFPLFLAPMAGVTDPIFRTLCKEAGADVMETEFVSAEGVLQAWQRNRRYVEFEQEHRPLGIQIFGSVPEHAAAAARTVVEAVAHSKLIAEAMDAYMQGYDLEKKLRGFIK